MLLVICYLYNARRCNESLNGCCSIDCLNINNLSLEEQKNLRKGEKTIKRIYKKT